LLDKSIEMPEVLSKAEASRQTAVRGYGRKDQKKKDEDKKRRNINKKTRKERLAAGDDRDMRKLASKSFLQQASILSLFFPASEENKADVDSFMKCFESGKRNELTAAVRLGLEKLDKLNNKQAMVRDILLRQLYNYIKNAGVEKFYHNQSWTWNFCTWLRIIFKLSQIYFIGEFGEHDCWMICSKKRPKMSLPCDK
jgi:hypothetical protein